MFDCPPGYLCDTETGNFFDYPCAAGSYNPLQKGTGDATTDCSACLLGHYCIEHTPLPIPCPKGTYNDGTTGKKPLDTTFGCFECPGGSKCPHVGMEAHEVCPDGTFSPPGSTECHICQAGFKCSNTGTSLQSYSDNACEGTVCTVLPERQFQEDCPAGYYCPA